MSFEFPAFPSCMRLGCWVGEKKSEIRNPKSEI